MSEFIREVDEEYRQERIRGLLGRYWISILALAVLVLIGVGGWRGYLYYRQQQNEAAAVRYFDAAQMVRNDRPAAFDAIAKDAPAGYRLLARFRAADELGYGDKTAGAKAFDALAADADVNPDLRDIARLRAAMLVADTADPAEVKRRFEPLADANAPFRNVAREILAVIAMKQGDDASAKRWLNATIADPVASQDQRQRGALLLGLIQSGTPGEAPPAPNLPAVPQPADTIPAAPPVGVAAPDEPVTPPMLSPATPDIAPPPSDAPSTPTAATPPAAQSQGAPETAEPIPSSSGDRNPATKP